MKIKVLLAILLVLGIFSVGQKAFAQGYHISGFKAEVYENEYGKPVLKIKPNVYDMHAPKNKKKTRVWGALICYRINGEPKVLRQDLTFEIMTKGYYETYLAYTSNARITGLEIEYFDATKPESTYPPKSSCH